MPAKKLKVKYKQDGAVKEIEVEVPVSSDSKADEVAEATHFVQTLADNHQIAEGPGPYPPCTTHQVETGADGIRKLKRRGFSFT